MHFGKWAERSAWIAGIALLMVYGGAKLWADHARVRGLEVLRSGSDAVVPVRQAEIDQSRWSAARVRAYVEAAATPSLPLGALLIPSIDLEVPVYEGDSELNLNRGAARIEGTAPLGAAGNVGIAAHRDGFFRGLDAVGIDAELILEVDGRHLHYRVTEISIVAPTAVHVLAPTAKPSITLVTCYPFYFLGNAPERYIVRAELADQHDGSVAFDRDRHTSAVKTSTRGTDL